MQKVVIVIVIVIAIVIAIVIVIVIVIAIVICTIIITIAVCITIKRFTSFLGVSAPLHLIMESMQDTMDPAESAPTSATITNAVAIRGGGIPLDESLHHSWVVRPTTILGRRFVAISCQAGRCREFFQGNFEMVKYIKELRDSKSGELMRAATQQIDPNDDSPAATTSVSDRPKRELIDQIPRVIEVEVETRNGIRATVNVVTTWRARGGT